MVRIVYNRAKRFIKEKNVPLVLRKADIAKDINGFKKNGAKFCLDRTNFN